MLSCACVARSARFFARFVVILACISSDLWTDTTETTIAQTPGSEEPEYGIATPLSLPCRRARGECVVLILRHFEPILSLGIYRSVCGMIHGVLILRYFEPRC